MNENAERLKALTQELATALRGLVAIEEIPAEYRLELYQARKALESAERLGYW